MESERRFICSSFRSVDAERGTEGSVTFGATATAPPFALALEYGLPFIAGAHGVVIISESLEEKKFGSTMQK